MLWSFSFCALYIDGFGIKSIYTNFLVQKFVNDGFQLVVIDNPTVAVVILKNFIGQHTLLYDVLVDLPFVRLVILFYLLV